MLYIDMTAITRIQKEAFLRRCNELSIDFLKKKIDAGEITLDDFFLITLSTFLIKGKLDITDILIPYFSL